MTRVLLLSLHLVVGLSAIGAGQVLARDPSGQPLTFKTEWLNGSPFEDYRIPGLFLLFVIAPSNLLSGLAQLKKHSAAPLLSTSTGFLLLVWLLIQTVIIGFQHWSQALWALVFGLVATLGVLQQRMKARE